MDIIGNIHYILGIFGIYFHRRRKSYHELGAVRRSFAVHANRNPCSDCQPFG